MGRVASDRRRRGVRAFNAGSSSGRCACESSAKRDGRRLERASGPRRVRSRTGESGERSCSPRISVIGRDDRSRLRVDPSATIRPLVNRMLRYRIGEPAVGTSSRLGRNWPVGSAAALDAESDEKPECRHCRVLRTVSPIRGGRVASGHVRPQGRPSDNLSVRVNARGAVNAPRAGTRPPSTAQIRDERRPLRRRQRGTVRTASPPTRRRRESR